MTINRALKPRPKSRIDFIIPKIHYGYVDNIEYYHVERNNFPIVNMIALLDFGYRLDEDGRRGLTYLASKMLLKGAGDYNSLELNEKFQCLGLNVSNGISEDNNVIYVQSLKENFEKAFSLISDVIYKPHLKEVDFLPEQKNLISVLQHAQKDPNSIFYNASNKVFGKNTSIEQPVYGYVDNVENISIENIRNFYEKVINKSKLTLFFTGNITRSEIEVYIRKYIGQRTSSLLKPETFYNNNPLSKELFYIDLAGKPQTIIGLAQKVDHYKKLDKFSLEIAINILGGSFTSRLNSNLREDKGFTYGISAYLNYHLDVGLIGIATSVDAENSINAVEEIYEEIDKLCNNISEEEIDFAKDNIINTFPMSFVTYHSINTALKNAVILGYPLNYWELFREEIRKRTAEQIRDTVRNTFSTKNTSAILIGDKENFNFNNTNEFFSTIRELSINGDIV